MRKSIKYRAKKNKSGNADYFQDFEKKTLFLDYLFSDNATINSLISNLSNYLNTPIRFYDNSLKLATGYGENLPKRWLCYDHIDIKMYREMIINQSLLGQTFIVNEEEDYGQGKFLVHSIACNGKLVGVLSIYFTRAIAEREIELIKYVSNLILLIYTKDIQFGHLNVKSQHENMVLELLANKITSLNQLLAGYHNAAHFFGRSIVLYILKIPKDNRNLTEKTIKDSINQLSNDYIVVSFENDIVVTYFCSDQDIPNEIEAYLENADLKLKAAVSDTFASILELQENYAKTIRIFNYNELFPAHQNKIFFYKDYKLLDLLCEINNGINWRGFRHSALNLLKEFDTQHATDYYHTLYHYLACNMEILKTAKAMHYHRNTVKYRIKRIKEIAGVDLNNTSEVFHLLLSYKLSEVSEKSYG